MDRLMICDLVVSCIIGVRKGERKRKQTVTLNIHLYGDWSRAGETDDLAQAVDYSVLVKGIEAFVAASAFGLLEALAEGVAAFCLRQPAVRKVTVTAAKHRAIHAAREVRVEITRVEP